MEGKSSSIPLDCEFFGEVFIRRINSVTSGPSPAPLAPPRGHVLPHASCARAQLAAAKKGPLNRSLAGPQPGTHASLHSVVGSTLRKAGRRQHRLCGNACGTCPAARRLGLPASPGSCEDLSSDSCRDPQQCSLNRNYVLHSITWYNIV